MLALARGLMREGHRVVLAAPEDFAGLARTHDVPYRRLCGPSPELVPSGQEGFGALLRSVRGLTEAQLEVLPGLVRGADLLVSGAGLFAGPSVAEAYRVPFRSFVSCPRALPSSHHAPASSTAGSSTAGSSTAGSSTAGSSTAERSPRWLNRLLWWAHDRRLQHLAGGVIAPWRARHGLSRTFRAYRDLVGPQPLLAADPLLAPLPPDLQGRVEQVGALFLDDPTPLPAPLEAFLAEGPPPVYLGFGSVKDADPAGTTRLLLEAVAAAGVRAVVSRGGAGLGEGPLPEGVLSVGPVSHGALLPRVAAVVHHGGAGTTHAALRAGVPQVVVPHLFDQFDFARRVHALGVGPAPLPRPQLTAERLTDALSACRRPAVRAQAAALRAQLRTDAVRRSVQLLTDAVGEADTLVTFRHPSAA
jgi:vancomycin aglycone glucosyltransferase